MRILLANEARAGAGGVETYLASLVRVLQARGHETAVLYGNTSAESGPIRITTAQAWSVADSGLAPAFDRIRQWQPDVCFSHNMRLLDVDEGLSAEWPTFKMMHGYFGSCLSGHKAFSFPALRPCGRVCGAGCLLYFWPRRCGQLRPGVMGAQYAWARRQQRLFNRYAGIVVASDHMRREYLRYDVPEQRVHTIPLFAAAAESGTTFVEGHAPPNDIDVLFLGRMTPLKGALQLVRATHHAARSVGRPLHLLLAGDGPDRDVLQGLTRELGTAVRVSFAGWVDETRRAELLSRASLLAIPSIWPEPFGLVGLEAAAFGVPAVAFDVGGIGEWLTHDVNGRFADLSGGPAALGDVIAGILADGAVRARLSSGARDVATRFTADAHVTRLEQILRSSR